MAHLLRATISLFHPWGNERGRGRDDSTLARHDVVSSAEVVGGRWGGYGEGK